MAKATIFESEMTHVSGNNYALEDFEFDLTECFLNNDFSDKMVKKIVVAQLTKQLEQVQKQVRVFDELETLIGGMAKKIGE